ncbi:MAG: ORF6N domain-containing protein [Draconibacterium sp.]
MDLQLIQSKIYEIRGQRVMLDFDLASLYGVETRVLNQAVKRNLRRFPADFMFQLSKKEFDNLMSQIVISNWGGTRKLPYAFTEHGVTMLASVLRSDISIEINIQIVRAFIALRQYALGYAELYQKLDNFMLETNLQFNDIYQALAEMASLNNKQNKTKEIGYLAIKNAENESEN